MYKSYTPIIGLLLICLTIVVGTAAETAMAQTQLTPIEQLGKSIFFDETLSIGKNQSCASCHGPSVGWTGPLMAINQGGAVYEGSNAGQFGDRKPPSAAYATLSPVFYWDKDGVFVGGNFWDGRATGERLGSPAADQAQGPFINLVEQALPDTACVVYRVCESELYPVAFTDVYGAENCAITWPLDVEDTCAGDGAPVDLAPNDRTKSNAAYDQVALAIAAFEDSTEVNAFAAKFDQEGRSAWTKQERNGFALFQGKGQCKNCHPTSGQKPLFTDFTFDNLGVPQNLQNPAGVEPEFVDPGLGGILRVKEYPAEVYEAEWGKHKVPTLRNVAKGSCEAEPDAPDCIVKAYGHNGYFKSLAEIVHFYNTRDVLARCDTVDVPNPGVNCWPKPEVVDNVNTEELGNLGLSAEEEAAIVAFLMILSDENDVSP